MKLTSFSFDSSSGVITCLALIASRVSSETPKSVLLGSLLVIAVVGLSGFLTHLILDRF